MKKFILTLAVSLGMVACASAQSPVYAPKTLGTFTCAAQAATNVAYIVNCQKQAKVTLQLVTTNDASGTAAINVSYSRSVDGVSYDAANIIGTAAAGTGTVITTTNLDSYGCGYIKINWVTNAAATANCSFGQLKYAVKISAP